MSKKKALFIVAQNGFRDEELLHTQKVLEEAGIKTIIASEKKGKARGKLGALVTAMLSVYEAQEKDFDAIVFVGGAGAHVFFEDEKVFRLIHKFEKAKKMVAAICIAPSILANAGSLMGKKVTAYPSEEQNLVNKGAEYTGMPVEIDGNIITANGPDAARDFGEKIVWSLS